VRLAAGGKTGSAEGKRQPMAITAVNIAPLEQRLADPTWRFVSGPVSSVPGFVLHVTNDRGTTGYGYVRALVPLDRPPAEIRAVLDRLIPRLPGRDEAGINAIMDDLDAREPAWPRVRAAIECALFDLRARTLGVPLADLFGGRRRASAPQLRMLALKAPEEMAAVAAGLAQEGYRFLKIKISGDAELDVARVRAIRQRLGPDFRLMVDANQSYSTEAALQTMPRIAEHGIELFEQPIPAADLDGLARLSKALAPLVVEADESAQSLPQILHLVANRIVGSINLRIANLGGIRNVLSAVALCEAAGVRYRFGATFAPRLYQAQALGVALTLPQMYFAHELAEFHHLQDDPFTGLEVRSGELAALDGPGAGVTPKEPTS
jgi:L-alanine-DL-glutamate epimerase-like enolase superfamily enzyme